MSKLVCSVMIYLKELRSVLTLEVNRLYAFYRRYIGSIKAKTTSPFDFSSY